MREFATFISDKKADKHGRKEAEKRGLLHSVEPFIEFHKDGSADHCYRVALHSRGGTFHGYMA